MSLRVSNGADAVATARQWIGTPYCWGGGHAGPVRIGTCVDCSGLVNQVYGTTGNTFSQVLMGSPVASINDAGPGDLVFFGPIAPGEPHHVGIYVGSGQMIDAPQTGTLVRQESINGFGPIYAIRRLVTTGSGGTSGTTTGQTQFNYAQLEGIWQLAGGNAQYSAMAAAIAMAESGGNSNASNTNSNKTIDRGLWQINSSNGSGSSFDIMTNARAAVAMSSSGQTWRPWCTAYSDGACGVHGGTYLGAGAPYQKFLQTGVAPDLNVPINGTSAVSPGGASGTDATLTGFIDCNAFEWAVAPGICGASDLFGSQAGKLAIKVIETIMKSVLNPIIQMVAGVMGIAAGGTLMILGIFVIVLDSRQGREVVKAGVGVGATALGQPEIGAAVTAGGVRQGAARYTAGRASQARFAERSAIIQQRGEALQDAIAGRSARQGKIRVQTAGGIEDIRTRGAGEREGFRTRGAGERELIKTSGYAARQSVRVDTANALRNQSRGFAAGRPKAGTKTVTSRQTMPSAPRPPKKVPAKASPRERQVYDIGRKTR